MSDKIYEVKDTSGAITRLHGPSIKKVRRGMGNLMRHLGLRIISVTVVGTYNDKAAK